MPGHEERGRQRNFRGGRRGGHRGSNQRGNYTKDVDNEAEKNNPFYSQFKNHANFLDKRHDKRQRLVKLSSDITIESKRIIFLLHRIRQKPMKEHEDQEEENVEQMETNAKGEGLSEEEEKIFVEADDRLRELERDMWKQVAAELADEDDFMYLRWYTGGKITTQGFYNYFQWGQFSRYLEI